MSQGLPNVYVSYAWGGESEKVVDEVEAALKARGIPFIRDKAELGYKGRIREFMAEIGRGHAVVVVLSDKYLRSPNCMFELIEITKSGDVHERIFPVVLPDADIYDMARRIDYRLHWKRKLDELNAKGAEAGMDNMANAPEQATLYDRYKDRVMELADLFGNMNALTPSMHASSGYKHLIAAIEDWMRRAPAVAAPAPAAAPAAGRPAASGPVGAVAGGAVPAVKIPGLRTATEALLAPQAGDGVLLAIAAGATGEETVLLSVVRTGADLVLQLGDDLAGLSLSPAALAQVAAAPAARRLGRVGQVGVDAVQAAVASVVGGVFGLPDDEHSVRAQRLSADEMEDGDASAAEDEGDGAGEGDDAAGPSVAESVAGFDEAVAQLLGRLPRGEHMLVVAAGDGGEGFWPLLIVQRDDRRELTALLPAAADLPPALRPARESVRQLREHFGFAAAPGGPAGMLGAALGSVNDHDAPGLGDALAQVLALAFGLPRDDFAFQAGVESGG
jgi:hypothetical protein